MSDARASDAERDATVDRLRARGGRGAAVRRLAVQVKERLGIR